MRAQLFSENSICIISDEKFELMVNSRAEIIQEQQKKDYEEAYKIAFQELSLIWKNFIFTPFDKTTLDEFSMPTISYYQLNDNIMNKWSVKENYNISEMYRKIDSLKEKIRECDDDILVGCEMLISGKSPSDIPSSVKDLITKRNEYRNDIKNIKELIEKIK